MWLIREIEYEIAKFFHGYKNQLEIITGAEEELAALDAENPPEEDTEPNAILTASEIDRLLDFANDAKRKKLLREIDSAKESIEARKLEASNRVGYLCYQCKKPFAEYLDKYLPRLAGSEETERCRRFCEVIARIQSFYKTVISERMPHEYLNTSDGDSTGWFLRHEPLVKLPQRERLDAYINGASHPRI